MGVIIKHTCSVEPKDYLYVRAEGDKVIIQGDVNEKLVELVFDVSTAIKFAKTLRTKINEAKEVSNG